MLAIVEAHTYYHYHHHYHHWLASKDGQVTGRGPDGVQLIADVISAQLTLHNVQEPVATPGRTTPIY